jgi:hypothetical protein
VEIIIMLFRLHNVLAFFATVQPGQNWLAAWPSRLGRKKKETLQEKGLRDVDEKGRD